MTTVGINPTEEKKKEDLNQLTVVHPHIFDGTVDPWRARHAISSSRKA
jgi:hypothetical protein